MKINSALFGAFLLFCVFFVIPERAQSQALEPSFQFIGRESGRLLTRVSMIGSLPPELVSYIRKGVPVLVNYRLELWRERSGWLDDLRDRAEISCKVRFDPWEKEFSIISQSPKLLVENTLREEREAFDLIMTTGPVSLEAGDTTGIFYLACEITVKTMSFSNFKEVESWLKGGVSDLEKPRLKDAPDKLGEFAFDMALRLTGFKNSARIARSRRFRLGGSGFAFEDD